MSRTPRAARPARLLDDDGLGRMLDGDDGEFRAGNADSDAEVVSDSEGLQRVGGAGQKRRGRPSGAGSSSGNGGRSGKKPRRAAVNEEEGEEEDGASAAPLAARIASNARSAAASSSLADPSSMSRVSRSAHSTQLSYFDHLAQPARRSNNTLKDVPKITEEQRARIAASLPDQHPAEKARLLSVHRSLMREWYLQLRAGFSVLAYGFGSKKRLLTEFAREWLTDAPVLVVNGYDAAANVKHVLNAFTRDLMLLPHSHTFRDLQSHVDFVREWFKKDEAMAIGGRRGRATDQADECSDSDEEAERLQSASSSSAVLPRVYLLVHSLDGPVLRHAAAQHVLASLASLPQVHLVASVDHARSQWMWDSALHASYRFVQHDCTTYAHYDAEFAPAATVGGSDAAGGEGSGLVESRSGRAAGIVNVLSSLTPNHRKVLDELAREQLTPNNPNFLAGSSGLVLRSAFLSLCEESMLVANNAAFERLMAELRDHALVDEKVVQRSKVLHIPYSELIIRRHILGQATDDAAVLDAAQRDAEQQAAQARRDNNVFSQAIGGEAPEEEEVEDDDESDDEDGAEE